MTFFLIVCEFTALISQETNKVNAQLETELEDVNKTMNKTWERLIVHADNLGLEFEFTGETLKFYSQDSEIGVLAKCKPMGWVLSRNNHRYLRFSNHPKRLISLIREIA